MLSDSKEKYENSKDEYGRTDVDLASEYDRINRVIGQFMHVYTRVYNKYRDKIIYTDVDDNDEQLSNIQEYLENDSNHESIKNYIIKHIKYLLCKLNGKTIHKNKCIPKFVGENDICDKCGTVIIKKQIQKLKRNVCHTCEYNSCCCSCFTEEYIINYYICPNC